MNLVDIRKKIDGGEPHYNLVDLDKDIKTISKQDYSSNQDTANKAVTLYDLYHKTRNEVRRVFLLVTASALLIGDSQLEF